MFNDVLRELRRMEQGERMPIELALDEEGYLDRVCPNPPCTVDFKVHFEDWRHKVPDEGVHCPICGFRAPSTEWNTPDQVEQIKAAALRHIHTRLGNAFDSDARRFKRSQRLDSFIKMSMSYHPGRCPSLFPLWHRR